MATAQVLISKPGPLPLTAEFTAEGDGDVLFFLSGSAWSSTGNSIGITLFLDGEPIGVSSGYTNEMGSHKTLIPILIPASITFGKHTVELAVASDATLTDLNDGFTVTLIY